MSEELPPSKLERIATVLCAHHVEFLVIGGQAEWLFGSPRITFDVDLCYRRSPENLRRLAAALTELDISLRGAPPGLPFILDARTLEMGNNFTFNSKFGDLDLLGYVEPLGAYEQLAAARETYQIGPLTLHTLSLPHLLTIKRHINRHKDQESIYQLLAIQRIRNEQSST